MVYIAKSTANEFYVTLSEKQTLTNPYFLFEFSWSGNTQRKVKSASDTTTYLPWYKFIITEGTDVTLAYDVDWKYRVWEQSSSTNTDPGNSTTLLETGIARVTGNETTTYTQTSEQISYKEFN